MPKSSITPHRGSPEETIQVDLSDGELEKARIMIKLGFGSEASVIIKQAIWEYWARNVSIDKQAQLLEEYRHDKALAESCIGRRR